MNVRPLTAALRFTTLNRPEEISTKRPERSLVEHKHKTGGRNVYGRTTSRRIRVMPGSRSLRPRASS